MKLKKVTVRRVSASLIILTLIHLKVDYNHHPVEAHRSIKLLQLNQIRALYRPLSLASK